MAMRSTGRRRSLRILSPDFIGKATDETATQVTRIGLTFLGTSAFCLLSLLSPDIALLGAGSEKTNVINVPFAGPVSFFGFMLDRAADLSADLCRAQRAVGAARTVNVDRAGANVGTASESPDPVLQRPDFLSAAAANNAALCLESRRIPRLGLGSA
jgi:hypothetical protein